MPCLRHSAYHLAAMPPRHHHLTTPPHCDAPRQSPPSPHQNGALTSQSLKSAMARCSSASVSSFARSRSSGASGPSCAGAAAPSPAAPAPGGAGSAVGRASRAGGGLAGEEPAPSLRSRSRPLQGGGHSLAQVEGAQRSTDRLPLCRSCARERPSYALSTVSHGKEACRGRVPAQHSPAPALPHLPSPAPRSTGPKSRRMDSSTRKAL